MKRFYVLALIMIMGLSVQAREKNKISMVTYFPVPYVAYSRVNVSKQMDVGLTSTCSMKLGCDEPEVTPIDANNVQVQSGRLELNGGVGIRGYSVTLGSGNGLGQIQFSKVRIESGNMESVNANDITVNALNLFGKPFPSCKEKDGTGQMRWQKLKLQGYSGMDPEGELYLTCGELGESADPEKDCSNFAYKSAHKSECCPGTPTTDSVCWKTCSEEWELGAPALINKSCSVEFTVKSTMPTWTNGALWCKDIVSGDFGGQSQIIRKEHVPPGIDSLEYTLAGNCGICQPGSTYCYGEGTGCFKDAKHLWQGADSQNITCMASGNVCKCDYKKVWGLPCIKKHGAGPCPNGW